MGIATTTLRLGIGGLMAAHGLQKFGKFGGAGLDATAEGFEKTGFVPGKPYAAAAAVTETVGGGLIALGYHTPLGASMVTGAMSVAIGKVHAKNGLFITKGGMEYNLALIGAAFALTEAGPGLFSIDGLLGHRKRGTGWALAELLVGVGAGAAVMALAGRKADDAPAFVDAAAQKVGSAAATVADAAGSVADSAASVSSSTNGSGSAAPGSNTASTTADKVADAAADTASKAADKVAGTASKAADKVSAGANKAAAKVDDAADKATPA